MTDFLLKASREFGTTILIVTHDPNVARAGDRILLIEDGVIKEENQPTPSEGLPTVQTYSILERLQTMLIDVQEAFKKLDEEFRQGRIDGDEYADRRVVLRHTRTRIENELHRMAIV